VHAGRARFRPFKLRARWHFETKPLTFLRSKSFRPQFGPHARHVLGTLDPGSESYSLECRNRLGAAKAASAGPGTGPGASARQQIRHDTTVSGRHGALRATPGARRGPKFILAWGAPLPYSEAGPLAVRPRASVRLGCQGRFRLGFKFKLVSGRSLAGQFTGRTQARPCNHASDAASSHLG
jgi:hypothetical protein